MTTPELESFAARWEEFGRLERLVNHWWWRPGWAVGRSFYTWHLTFDDATAAPLHGLVARLHDGLAGVEGLDLIPQQWLHMTMQGLGFTDEVSDDDVEAITRAAGKRLAEVPQFDLTLGPIQVDDEATGLLVRPWTAVAAVRDGIREAIAEVWDEVPENPEFHPHVSIAYSNADVPTGPVRDRVAPLRDLEPVTIPVAAAQLIRLNRDNQMYEWDVVADVPLGMTHSPRELVPGMSQRDVEPLVRVCVALGLELENPAADWPGYGKVVRLQGDRSIYINRTNADVRASAREVAAWHEAGVGTVRPDNERYLRVMLDGT